MIFDSLPYFPIRTTLAEQSRQQEGHQGLNVGVGGGNLIRPVPIGQRSKPHTCHTSYGLAVHAPLEAPEPF